VWATLGLSILSGFLFSIMLALIFNLGAVYAGQHSWFWAGMTSFFVSDYFIMKKGKDKKEKAKAKKSLKWESIIFPIMMLIGLFWGISEDICLTPKEKLGFECCIPSEEIPMICQEEEDVLVEKLEYSIENEQYTDGSRITHYNPNFSFKLEEGYLMAEDIKMMGLKVPYYFIASGEDEDDLIELIVMVDNAGDNDATKFFEDYYKGILEGQEKYVGKIEIVKSEDILIDNKFNANVYNIFKDDETINIETYSTNIVFLDDENNNMYSLIFSATESMSGYLEEFIEMVESFRVE
ncbi:hypothetical protein ACFLUF_02805, partial [Chloroflexota bacterium]